MTELESIKKLEKYNRVLRLEKILYSFESTTPIRIEVVNKDNESITSIETTISQYDRCNEFKEYLTYVVLDMTIVNGMYVMCITEKGRK